jgi:hypothetical protein
VDTCGHLRLAGPRCRRSLNRQVARRTWLRFPKLTVRVRFPSPAPAVTQREQGLLACITERDTVIVMASAISVRLDDEALRALSQLESVGLSRSEAIRRAILESAARLNRRAALAAEAAALEADEDDRREMLEIAALMESLRATG